MSKVHELKEKVAIAHRILHAAGLGTTAGHASARIPGTDRILIKPHQTVRNLADVKAEDIITVDLDGKKVAGEGKEPSEIFLHTSVYLERSDVGSVVHVHPLVSTAFSSARKESAIFTDGIPVFEYSGLISTKELGQSMTESLGAHTCLLLRGHGVVVVGRDVEEACVSTIYLEHTARKQLLVSIIEAMTMPTARHRSTEVRNIPAIWAYYKSKVSER